MGGGPSPAVPPGQSESTGWTGHPHHTGAAHDSPQSAPNDRYVFSVPYWPDVVNVMMVNGVMVSALVTA